MDAYRNFVRFTELGSIGLTLGQIARIDNGQGIRLRVEAGSVWVTEQPGVDDVCLAAGESHRISNPGKTLISALRAPFALVTVEPALPSADARRALLEGLGTPLRGPRPPDNCGPLGDAMPSEHFMSTSELKALRQRAADQRAKYLGHLLKAVLATAKALVRGTVPGGIRAAQ